MAWAAAWILGRKSRWDRRTTFSMVSNPRSRIASWLASAPATGLPPANTSSYKAATARVTFCQVKWSWLRRIACRPNKLRNWGFSDKWKSRSASRSGWFGGMRYPVSPSFTVNLMPPTFAPITGVPHAIASMGVIPNGSYQGVVTKTSAAL